MTSIDRNGMTVYDHLFILPVLYVLTMMASQELSIRNTAAQAHLTSLRRPGQRRLLAHSGAR